MEIIFSKREVYINEKTESEEDVKIGGQLQIIKNVNC